MRGFKRNGFRKVTGGASQNSYANDGQTTDIQSVLLLKEIGCTQAKRAAKPRACTHECCDTERRKYDRLFQITKGTLAHY
mmetsp:Transcript_20077/g.43558  ORF Transcript_20077/g.43558 Transcript_20077/m.43558 type:complete len:80 (+) Transcript_20077:736-975(+)